MSRIGDLASLTLESWLAVPGAVGAAIDTDREHRQAAARGQVVTDSGVPITSLGARLTGTTSREAFTDHLLSQVIESSAVGNNPGLQEEAIAEGAALASSMRRAGWVADPERAHRDPTAFESVRIRHSNLPLHLY
ncbi:MAG: hypothetical protein AAF658_13630, partial [Myxococcota bacterium]